MLLWCNTRWDCRPAPEQTGEFVARGILTAKHQPFVSAGAFPSSVHSEFQLINKSLLTRPFILPAIMGYSGVTELLTSGLIRLYHERVRIDRLSRFLGAATM